HPPPQLRQVLSRRTRHGRTLQYFPQAHHPQQYSRLLETTYLHVVRPGARTSRTPRLSRTAPATQTAQTEKKGGSPSSRGRRRRPGRRQEKEAPQEEKEDPLARLRRRNLRPAPTHVQVHTAGPARRS